MTAPRMFGLEMLSDPYPIYERLRAAHPVFYAEEIRAWLVSSYNAVNTALRSPQFSSERYPRMKQVLAKRGFGELVDDRMRSMLHMDAPDHTRLRSLVNKAFTPRIVEAMEGRIQQLADQLLDAVGSRGEMDVIEQLAYPLPVMVIAEMLGVPVEDRARFRKWSDETAAVASGNLAALPEEELRRGFSARNELTDYFRGKVAEQRDKRNDNLLSALVQAEEEGGRLTENELYSTLVLLLVAGNETTTNLIGNGLHALLRHPDQLRRVADDRTLIPSAVEEMLRYDSPVQLTTRAANTDLDLSRTRIKQGDFVYLFIGAANRDPAQFDHPDRFDVSRPDNKHLAFGAGHHFCLGAPLARLEAQVAIRTLLRRYPRLRLSDDDLQYRNNFNLRGLKALPTKL